MKITDKYILFWSGILSNWASTPYSYGGEQYCCSEQQFMRYKAMHFKDLETAQQIMHSTDPKRIKALGRKVKNYDDAVWDKVRVMYMTICLNAKFEGNEKARRFLINLPDLEFAEANPFDSIWGIGLREDDSRALNKHTWKGRNLLGQCMTDVYHRIKHMYT